MSSTVRLTTPVLQGTTQLYTATAVDENGDAIDGTTDLSTLTLTYYDEDTSDIINSRNNQNVLQQNNVTVDSAGLLTWIIQPNDAQLVDDRKELEYHIAMFTWTWALGTKINRHEVRFPVERITYG